jgi:hypothetical protein
MLLLGLLFSLSLYWLQLSTVLAARKEAPKCGDYFGLRNHLILSSVGAGMYEFDDEEERTIMDRALLINKDLVIGDLRDEAEIGTLVTDGSVARMREVRDSDFWVQPSLPVPLVDVNFNFALDRHIEKFRELTEGIQITDQLQIVAVCGIQSTGKSSLNDVLFNTLFETKTFGTTTAKSRGLDISRSFIPSAALPTLIIDAEGVLGKDLVQDDRVKRPKSKSSDDSSGESQLKRKHEESSDESQSKIIEEVEIDELPHHSSRKMELGSKLMDEEELVDLSRSIENQELIRKKYTIWTFATCDVLIITVRAADVSTLSMFEHFVLEMFAIYQAALHQSSSTHLLQKPNIVFIIKDVAAARKQSKRVAEFKKPGQASEQLAETLKDSWGKRYKEAPLMEAFNIEIYELPDPNLGIEHLALYLDVAAELSCKIHSGFYIRTRKIEKHISRLPGTMKEILKIVNRMKDELDVPDILELQCEFRTGEILRRLPAEYSEFLKDLDPEDNRGLDLAQFFNAEARKAYGELVEKSTRGLTERSQRKLVPALRLAFDRVLERFLTDQLRTSLIIFDETMTIDNAATTIQAQAAIIEALFHGLSREVITGVYESVWGRYLKGRLEELFRVHLVTPAVLNRIYGEWESAGSQNVHLNRYIISILFPGCLDSDDALGSVIWRNHILAMLQVEFRTHVSADFAILASKKGANRKSLLDCLATNGVATGTLQLFTTYQVSQDRQVLEAHYRHIGQYVTSALIMIGLFIPFIYGLTYFVLDLILIFFISTSLKLGPGDIGKQFRDNVVTPLALIFFKEAMKPKRE